MIRSGLSALAIAGVMLVGMQHARADAPVIDATVAAAVNSWGSAINQSVTDTTRTINQTNDNLTKVINQMSRDLQDALRSHSGQQTANFQQRTQADAALRETQDNRGVQQRVEGARYNAALAASSGASGCNIMTGVVGATGLFNTAISARTQLTNLVLDYQLGEGRNAAVRNGTQAAIGERVAAVCTNFGTQGMVDDGTCPSVTQPNASDGKVSDALNADVVLNNSVLTTQQQKAARIFVSNAIVPAPVAPVQRDMRDTPQGKALTAMRWSSAARNGIAAATINESIAARIPLNEAALGSLPTANVGGTSTPTTTVRQWAEGTAKGMLGGLPAGQNYPNGISLYAWMDLRARSFYLDPNFMATVNRNSADQNTKDMVLMQGVQTYLQWQQFKQQERTNVLLATMVSMMDQQITAQATSGAAPR